MPTIFFNQLVSTTSVGGLQMAPLKTLPALQAELTSLRFFKPLASEAFHRMVNIEQIGLIQLEYHLDTLENEGGRPTLPSRKEACGRSLSPNVNIQKTPRCTLSAEKAVSQRLTRNRLRFLFIRMAILSGRVMEVPLGCCAGLAFAVRPQNSVEGKGSVL